MNWAISAMVFCCVALAGEAKIHSIEELSFIEGSWLADDGGVTTEELWSTPRAGTMLGVGRTIKGDKTVFFEMLRLEQRGDDIFYVAQPRGGKSTDFKLTSLEDGKAVFENPEHDFPTKITYESIDKDTLRASIAGQRNGKTAEQKWEYKRSHRQ